MPFFRELQERVARLLAAAASDAPARRAARLDPLAALREE
jgi:ABC-type lipoprotein release transport system permease subunit